MKPKRNIRIVIIEDNEFYNQLLTRQLKNYIEPIADDNRFYFEINSYTNPFDCLRNLKSDTDIAFIDYYLGDSVTGIDIMKTIKQKSPDCNVIILSRVKSTRTSLLSLLAGASEFIFKDMQALTRSCYIAEEIIQSRTSPS